jgi:hypothetical protein
VDLWLKRYEADGIAGLIDRARGAGREQMPVLQPRFELIMAA